MKRPVIIVTDAISRCQGGAEIYLTDLAAFIAQQGHPVRVLVRKPCSDPLPEGVSPELVDTGHTQGVAREKKFAQEVHRRLPTSDAIILSTVAMPGITHYQPHAGYFRAAFAASGESNEPGLRRRFHRLATRLNPKRRWLITQQELLLRPAHGPQLMTFSQAVRAQLLHQNPASAYRTTTLPLGVDLQRFQPNRSDFTARPATSRLRLLFVANNFRLKGLHCLLTALAQAVQRGLDAELVIGGDDSLAPYKSQLAALAARVQTLGAINESDMARHYHDCDTLVHPTFTDHCSLVVLEALASGKPVITTAQNGAAELMHSGREGIIVPHPRDLPALTNALLQLRDRTTLMTMSQAAIALRPRLDFTAHARKVLAWLTDDAERHD